MAYRNRYDEYLRKRQGVLPDAKQWKAADYARISREDGDKEESDSIGTQFDIIDDYIAHNDDITFIDRYSDDGWSGTNFDRPDFMRLMEDIKKGKMLEIWFRIKTEPKAIRCRLALLFPRKTG